MANPVFPDDFQKKPHMINNLPGAGDNWHWELVCPQTNSVLVSVVGGDFSGLHGDGVDTFEMWDFTEQDPRGWLTAEQINEHLRSKNIVWA